MNKIEIEKQETRMNKTQQKNKSNLPFCKNSNSSTISNKVKEDVKNNEETIKKQKNTTGIMKTS